MKGPLCGVCLTSDILCTGCESKLKSGELTDGDVSFSRALVQMAESHPVLENIEFIKTISHSGIFVVIVPRGMLKNIIGKQGVFVKELSRLLGAGRLKIVEETSNPREMVSRIIYPANLLGVNVVFHEKKQTYKIRIPTADQTRMSDKKPYEHVLEKLLGMKTAISFE